MFCIAKNCSLLNAKKFLSYLKIFRLSRNKGSVFVLQHSHVKRTMLSREYFWYMNLIGSPQDVEDINRHPRQFLKETVSLYERQEKSRRSRAVCAASILKSIHKREKKVKERSLRCTFSTAWDRKSKI